MVNKWDVEDAVPPYNLYKKTALRDVTGSGFVLHIFARQPNAVLFMKYPLIFRSSEFQ